ncbi:ATPase MORC2-like isoform X2 [Tachypleus tridentatus]|uniref:ATPase MORC2-like isoform X2 n=1 Tax=Tachypleus tridentatus TaxID=6853 RepID=UPI003FD347EC
MDDFSDLNRAQLSVEYLHANSTTHEFLFGALAEMVDNARDAGSTCLNIYTTPCENVRGGFLLCFLDNGIGMDPVEATTVITFGKSLKRGVDSMIGQYGNGLKSGSMRIGNDMILFTKKGSIVTSVLMSRTFLEEKNLEQVVVPIPSFHADTLMPYGVEGSKAETKHSKEMDIIHNYSPFKTKEELIEQFSKIKGDSGTLVIIYNIKLQNNGEPELDVHTDPLDILIYNKDGSDLGMTAGEARIEWNSFRAYTSILYCDPRMKIKIQGKKVRSRQLTQELYKPRCYWYVSSYFQARSLQDAKKALQEAHSVEMKLKEAESKARHLEKDYDCKLHEKNLRYKLRKAQMAAANIAEEHKLKKLHSDSKQKNYRGLVGIVDIPYTVLEPTHNKQDFANAKEFKFLQKTLLDYVEQYYRDCELNDQEIDQFWESFGYFSSTWSDPPSNDVKYLKMRAMQVNTFVQCDSCLKWRRLPYSSKNVDVEISGEWTCSMNPDVQRNKCSVVEEKLHIPEGKLVKISKSTCDQRELIQKEMAKLKRRLQKVDDKSPLVTSTGEGGKVPEKSSFGCKLRQRVDSGPVSSSKSSSFDRHRSSSWEELSESSSAVLAKPRKRHFSTESATSVETCHQDIAANVEEGEETVVDQLTQEEAEPKSRENFSHDRGYQKLSCKKQIFFKQKQQTVKSSVPSSKNNKSRYRRKKRRQRVSVEEPVMNISSPDKSDDKEEEQDVINSSDDQDDITSSTMTTQKSSSICTTQPDLSLLPSSTCSVVHSESAQDSPSSTSTVREQNLSQAFKTCLCFFLPPDWTMDRETISNLTVQELTQFPLEDFIDYYEKRLHKFINKVQEDADKAQQQLASNRKLVAKFLKTIDKDFDIDPECDTEQVDELLKACLVQANLQSPTSIGD